MTPAVWIAFASLAVIVLVQSVGAAFLLGRLFEEVANLKAGSTSRASQGETIARMDNQIGHISKQMDEMTRKMDERLAFLAPPPVYQPQPSQRRRRSAAPPAE